MQARSVIDYTRMRPVRWHRSLAASLAAFCVGSAAQAAEQSSIRPDGMYLEAGFGKDVASATAGLTWDLSWQHENALGLWGAYLDLSLGEWRVSDSGLTSSGRKDVSRVGLTPVLRLQPKGWNRFFLEAGIGANWIFPIYQNGDHRFSTTFKFGDHLAVGWKLDASGDQELMLRLQHVSNAGIKHPNPGENFLQLRYAHRF
jgi:lipid A 3-O-deacylase